MLASAIFTSLGFAALAAIFGVARLAADQPALMLLITPLVIAALLAFREALVQHILAARGETLPAARVVR